MSDITVEQLNERINGLSSLVEKQSALISKTGQQLIEMQVKNVKTSMNNMDMKKGKSNDVDLSDYVTNDDIVQLVGELQTQLDSLEQRSINRVLNSKCQSPEDKITSVTNKDGDVMEDLFPKTVKDFKGLDKVSLIQLAEFYELILPDAENVDQFLHDNKSQSIEQAHSNSKDSIAAHIDDFSDQDISAIRQDLAKFLGLVHLIE